MSAIKIVDYEPSWPALFEFQRADIERLIGGLVEDIHHIGSTSVVGLCAKPKIDIDVVMGSDDFLPEAIERVKPCDYAFHGDPYGDGMWTFTQGHGSHGTRLYLCGPNNPTHIKRMRFRDYLRGHPEAAAAYGALKRKLAAGANGDWTFYTGGKSDFVAEILIRAAEASKLPISPLGDVR